jgi:hypothetical protein
MVRAVVDHVATLAQALQVAKPIVPRIVIEMGRGQDYPRVADLGHFDKIGPACRSTVSAALDAMRRIKPSAIVQTADFHAVGPAATLADAASAIKANAPADVRPVARIKAAHLRLDRHYRPRPYPAINISVKCFSSYNTLSAFCLTVGFQPERDRI